MPGCPPVPVLRRGGGWATRPRASQITTLWVPPYPRTGTTLWVYRATCIGPQCIDHRDGDKKNNKILIEATVMPPGDNCKPGKAPSYPVHFVETRKMSGEPELKLETQQQSACTD